MTLNNSRERWYMHPHMAHMSSTVLVSHRNFPGNTLERQLFISRRHSLWRPLFELPETQKKESCLEWSFEWRLWFHSKTCCSHSCAVHHAPPSRWFHWSLYYWQIVQSDWEEMLCAHWICATTYSGIRSRSNDLTIVLVLCEVALE